MTDEEQIEKPSGGPNAERQAGATRASIGALTAIQVFLAILLFISLNFLSGSHHKTWDVSQDKSFSLSSQTRQLLTSAMLGDRDAPVRIIAAVRKNSAHFSRLRAMLQAYERLADGGITVTFVDYVRETDAALEIADEYDTTFIEDVVIVDAVPVGEPRNETRGENPAALRQAHIRYVAVEDMLVYGAGLRQNRRLIGYQDEDQITSTLRRALEGAPRKFYFLADKSKVSSSDRDTPWDFLSRTFSSLNIQLVPINIAGLSAIPDDAAGVALVAPRFDLNAEEEKVLRAYWSRPRAALFVILNPALKTQPPNLRKFLREHGITPREVRLSTRRGNQQSFTVSATFTNAAATGDLGNASTLFEGPSSMLEVRESAPDLEVAQIVPLALITARANVQADPLDGSAPLAGPHHLAASVSRGNERNDNTSDATSRMIVTSNATFLESRSRYKEHIDFVRNGSNWLIGREDMMGLGPKPVQYYKLLLPPSKVSFANKLNLFFFPGSFLLASLFVWNTRRA